MFSHCCGRSGAPGFTDAWTRKYIFPGGYIPALSELVTESEKNGWQVMDVEAMRFHYSHTLEEWYNRTGHAQGGDRRASTTTSSTACGSSTSPAPSRRSATADGQLAADLREGPQRRSR
jgi:hypothetical protein